MLLAGCSDRPEDGFEPVPPSEAGSHRWNVTGMPWAVNLEFDPGVRSCALAYNLEGTSPIARSVLAIIVEDASGLARPLFVGPGAPADSVSVQASAQGSSQSLENNPAVSWSLNTSMAIETVSGEPVRSIVLAVRDVTAPGKVLLDCPATPASIREAGNLTWLDAPGEGFGASASMAGGASRASVQGRFTATSPGDGYLGVQVDGDLLMAHAAAGRLHIEYPGGQDDWLLAPRHLLVQDAAGDDPRDSWRSYRAGAGEYSVTADFSSAYPTASFEGIFVAWS